MASLGVASFISGFNGSLKGTNTSIITANFVLPFVFARLREGRIVNCSPQTVFSALAAIPGGAYSSLEHCVQYLV